MKTKKAIILMLISTILITFLRYKGVLDDSLK